MKKKVAAAVKETTDECWCGCVQPYQDDRYGAQIRVHNYGPKANSGAPGWRCTGCGREKPA